MNAFVKFNRGVFQLPIAVRLWLLFLMTVNLVVPVIYLHRSEARVTLLVFFASFLLMLLITHTSGFTRLLGMGHVLWIPLGLYLINRLDVIPAGDAYGTWVRSVIVLNSISLVLDIFDVMRFVRGERSEIISVE
jgi:hypothetical protein